MTKLYYVPREGWTVPGKQPKGAIRVDPPNNPEELAAWLNVRAVGPNPAGAAPLLADPMDAEGTADLPERRDRGDAAGDKPQHPGHCPRCDMAPANAALLVENENYAAIADWIGTARPAHVEQLFGLLGARFHELRKAAGQ